jgi:hypothetical protein
MRPREIRGIHVEKEMHVAGVVSNTIILSCRYVVEHSVSGGEDFLGRVSLLRCDFVGNGQE